MRTRAVLFVHSYPHDELAPFVKQDLVLLQHMYHVEELALRSISMPRGPLFSLAVWQAIARNDLTFGWFCPLIGIIARILRKPFLLVGGGADVVDIPMIGYGPSLVPRRRRVLRNLGFKLTSRVLLFSDSSRYSLLALPGIHADNLHTLYLGVDGDHFRPSGEKKPRALTVAYVNESNLRRKGLRSFAEASRTTPEIPYRLVGKLVDRSVIEEITAIVLPNFQYLGYLDETQLLTEYQQARVYAQLSMHEGFGMAMAEAMACECVPVVTAAGAIPEVVGDTGIYVPIEDPAAAGEAIQEVIRDPNSDSMGRRARQRIVDLFPVSRRKEGLRAAIETVISRAKWQI